MKRPREAWYRNPFRLGATGLILLLAGYGLLATHVADASLSPLAVLGKLAYLAGLMTVLAAGVIWFLDARRPEPLSEDEEEEQETP